MKHNKIQKDDEIFLKEIILNIWAYKILIIIFIAFSTSYSIYYALNADKLYAASNMFSLQTPKAKNSSAELDPLSLFSGISLGNSTSASLKEELMGRIFIENLDEKLDLRSDKYFNLHTYDKIIQNDPLWKSKLKEIIGYSSPVRDQSEVIWLSTISTYKDSVSIDTTESGNYVITVTHSDPTRAALIANEIMNIAIKKVEKKAENLQNDQVNFLSETLAKSLYELESAQTKLKEFTIDNSTLPMEGFAAASVNSEVIKNKYLRATQLISAIKAVEKVTKNNELNKSNYYLLRTEHPIIDQVEFRRIFGQNENISDWTWPDIESISTVLITLEDRKKRLYSDLKLAQENTRLYAEKNAKYIKLKREASVAEATYTVMIEQVKANSLLVGMQENNNEIFEYAAVPINASRPRRSQIVLIGLMLGLFAGVTCAILLGSLRGVYFSRDRLLSDNDLSNGYRYNILKKYRKKTYAKLMLLTNKKVLNTLDNVKIDINIKNKKYVLISGLNAKIKAKDFSRLLCISMQLNGQKVAYIDFSNNSQKDMKDSIYEKNKNFILLDEINNLKILSPSNFNSATSFFTSKDSNEILNSLSLDFDRIIVSIENTETIPTARFFSLKDVYHIALVKKKITKRIQMEELNSILPIGALFHD